MTDCEAVAELAATVARQQEALETLTGVVELLQKTVDRVVSCGANLETRVGQLEIFEEQDSRNIAAIDASLVAARIELRKLSGEEP